MSDLQGLLDRVRAATGPDWTLNHDIWFTIAEKPSGLSSPIPPSITASTDAVAALAERLLPGCVLTVAFSGTPEAWLDYEDGDTGDGRRGATPALAALAALLAYLIAKGGGGG